MSLIRFLFWGSLAGLFYVAVWPGIFPDEFSVSDVRANHAYADAGAVKAYLRQWDEEAKVRVVDDAETSTKTLSTIAQLTMAQHQQLQEYLRTQGYTIVATDFVGPMNSEEDRRTVSWLLSLACAAIASICFMLMFLAKRRKLLTGEQD